MAIVPAGVLSAWEGLVGRLRAGGEVIPLLVMRLLMGWEFWESGWEKYNGENWFASIQEKFPFPFSVIPANISWGMATWFEIGGAVLLWLGLGTRFVAFSLLFLTFVATAAVHWPDMISMWTDLAKGYAITDMGYGNFKLPLLFVVMLLPLIFNGPGKISLDYLVARACKAPTSPREINDLLAWALILALLGLPFLMLIPKFGAALLVLALVLAIASRWARRT